MAQIIIYKTNIDLQNENLVEVSDMDLLLEYLQESGMIVYNSVDCNAKDLAFLEILKIAFHYVSFIDTKENEFTEIALQNQLCKQFSLIDKKQTLRQVYKTLLP
ncbi:MAG: hypothetical protein FWG20_02420 [Candidatus Cloacimonetes bacterium]|nr:hypothetical protein [Candidatus Cloacimonadota bacterium]